MIEKDLINILLKDFLLVDRHFYFFLFIVLTILGVFVWMMVSNQKRVDRVVKHNQKLGVPVQVKSSLDGSVVVAPKADSEGVAPKADIPPEPEHPDKIQGT